MTSRVDDIEFVKLCQELGTRGTAEHLGITARSVRSRKQRLREKGIAFNDKIPEGHQLKGKSTLYDADGEIKLEWVKTGIDRDERELIQQEVIEALKDQINPTDPITSPTNTSENLITLYPVGDHHFGMLAWGEETGEADYDLTIAEDLLLKATKHLIESSPDSDQAALLLLGDFLHYDSFQPVTPAHKNLLDADGRFPKMVRTAIRAIRFQIEEMLKKHKNIKLIIEIGNHDPVATIWLMEAFNMFYENEPRVSLDTTPRPFHCFTFGANFIGTHHGDKVKMTALPLVFASDYATEWGETVYRTIHTGHIHHDNVKESPGVIVESHGILAPGDAYSATHGYRSRRSMKAIVLHKQHGEVSRITVNPDMLQ